MLGLTKPSLLLSLLVITAGCTQQYSNQTHSHSHGHSHSHALHHGVMAPLFSVQQQVGFAEIKLHDDKGDLELWLTKDETGGQPLDLPVNSEVTVSFQNLAIKSVALRIRNYVTNEDEGGKGNIRDNKTNYFIFPGDTGADASYLMGKDFTANTAISFIVNGVQYTTHTFKLRPHTH